MNNFSLWLVRKLPERSGNLPERLGQPEGKFLFFAPDRLLVQKVETTSIMQNSGQVSPPPATRITIPYTFAASQQANKQITVW